MRKKLTIWSQERRSWKAVLQKTNRSKKAGGKKTNEIVDRIYKDFSTSVGVTNIHEYEEKQLKDAQALQGTKLRLSNQLSKLKYQQEYEQKRDMHDPTAKLNNTHESLEKKLKGMQERECHGKADADVFQIRRKS